MTKVSNRNITPERRAAEKTIKTHARRTVHVARFATALTYAAILTGYATEKKEIGYLAAPIAVAGLMERRFARNSMSSAVGDYAEQMRVKQDPATKIACHGTRKRKAEIVRDYTATPNENSLLNIVSGGQAVAALAGAAIGSRLANEAYPLVSDQVGDIASVPATLATIASLYIEKPSDIYDPYIRQIENVAQFKQANYLD